MVHWSVPAHGEKVAADFAWPRGVCQEQAGPEGWERSQISDSQLRCK